MRRRGTQVRDGFLERVAAIIKGQQGLLAKAASSAGVSTVEAGLGLRTAFSIVVRLRHLATVLGVDIETGG